MLWDQSADDLVLAGAAGIDLAGDIDVDGTAHLDVVDIDGAVDMASTLTLAGNADFNGDLDVDGTTNLDAVDIDGAVQIDNTVTVGVNDTGYDVKFFGATATNGYMLWDESTDDLILGSSSKLGIGTTSPQQQLHISEGSSGATADADCQLVIDSNANAGIHLLGGSSSNLDIRFGDSDDATAGIIRFNSTDGYMYFGTSDDNGAVEAMRIDSSGKVGIGDSSPDAHLDVEDLTIDTTATYTGIYSRHTKTAGATDASDSLIGVFSEMTHNDDNAYFNNLYGGIFTGSSEASAGESNSIYGIKTTAYMGGSTDVGNIYGVHSLTDFDAGRVDVDVIGQLVEVDIDGGTVGDHIKGEWIKVDTTVNPSGAVFGLDIWMQGAGADASGDTFLRCRDQENSDTVAQITALAGVATFDSGDFSGAPDYAEYFESKDGNAIAVGTTVKLDGDKVIACSEGDTPIGVVRPDGVGTSAYKAGAQILRWHGKYLYDDYNELQHEDYEIIQWTESITKEEFKKRGKDETGGVLGGQVKDEQIRGSKAIPAKEAVTRQKTVDEEVEEEVTTTELVDGKYVQKTKTVTKTVKVPQYDEEDLYDEDGEVIGKHQVPIMETVEEAVAAVDAVAATYFREHKYHSDRIPDGLTVPDDAEIITPAKQRQKLNPDYDPDREYESREERDEWHIVGLLGQIPTTKGQPVADNWIKMKDVSDTVEMYFVK